MKKLIIQIPCYNEEDTLGVTINELPREVEGFDVVEWLIIDDGSTDKTVNIAIDNGVDHIIKLAKNTGLANAFMTGIQSCLKLGAQVIVNLDADNQYFAGDIPKLVKPILEGKAEIVVGARPINDIKHFSLIKKFFQKFGSWVVRLTSRTDIQDAPSGFRAFSREAAMRLNVFSDYSYTIETIIQAGQKNMCITWVPIRTNSYLRPSRLMKSLVSYLKNSMMTIIRIFVVYNPFRFFMTIGLSFFIIGLMLGARYLFVLFTHSKGAHIQSLILASILLGVGFQNILVAFIADLLSVNRKLLEDIQFRLKKVEYDKNIDINDRDNRV